MHAQYQRNEGTEETLEKYQHNIQENKQKIMCWKKKQDTKTMIHEKNQKSCWISACRASHKRLAPGAASTDRSTQPARAADWFSYLRTFLEGTRQSTCLRLSERSAVLSGVQAIQQRAPLVQPLGTLPEANTIRAGTVVCTQLGVKRVARELGS